MKVYVPSSLRSYTGKQNVVQADGATLADLLFDLDRRYPGMRFRVIDEQDHIREHIRIFVNRDVAPNLAAPLKPDDEVRFIMAISGG
ncbi:MAG: MoaD/ThiS family protein [Chloroflexi bacterium]|nr:MoaD/ThiS family protein [Chloroflexota bacterium]